VPDGKKWLLKHLPYYARWYRFLLFWPGSDALLKTFFIDPDWPHPERSVSELNDGMRIVMTAYIESQVGEDEELRDKVVPRYPPFVKRILQDNGSWLGALRRENVDLQTSGVARATPKSLIAEDGSEYPIDLIVFATGFHTQRFLWPMSVIGRAGASLAEEWGDDPRAYLGITVPKFPNLFCLYGPGTNLAHAGSIIFHSECQVRYIMGCLKALLVDGHRALDCREDVANAFHQRHIEETSKLVLSHTGTRSWYKNDRGQVTCTSPWRLVDYWRWTREPDLSDYELT
jgi:4-hydroxyacetophenone monooxygenase